MSYFLSARGHHTHILNSYSLNKTKLLRNYKIPCNVSHNSARFLTISQSEFTTWCTVLYNFAKCKNFLLRISVENKSQQSIHSLLHLPLKYLINLLINMTEFKDINDHSSPSSYCLWRLLHSTGQTGWRRPQCLAAGGPATGPCTSPLWIGNRKQLSFTQKNIMWINLVTLLLQHEADIWNCW